MGGRLAQALSVLSSDDFYFFYLNRDLKKGNETQRSSFTLFKNADEAVASSS